MKQLIQDLQGLGFEGLFTYHPYELVETGEMVDNQPVYTSDRNMDRLEIAPRNEYFYLCDAQRWLREEKGIDIDICGDYGYDADEKFHKSDFYYVDVHTVIDDKYIIRDIRAQKTYDLCLQLGIEEAIKILKEQG